MAVLGVRIFRFFKALAVLAAFSTPAASQDNDTNIRLEVRNVRSVPLNGYLLIRPAPPAPTTMAGLAIEPAARRFYDYFRDPLASANYSLAGQDAPLVMNGVIEFSQREIRLDGAALRPGVLVYVFFYWSSANDVLPGTGTAEERLARTDRVTWWTLDLDASEGPASRLVQRAVILDRLHWAENGDFRDAPFGRTAVTRDGYVPGKQEQVTFVLEPPLNDNGSVILPDASRPGYPHPVLLVHGLAGNAATWNLNGGSSIPRYLRAKGIPVWELHHTGYGVAQDSGDFMQTAATQIRTAHPRPGLTQIDVVTHGTAGFGLRSILRRAPNFAQFLGRILMLAPSFRGIHLASRLRNYSGQTVETLAQRMAPFGPAFHDPLSTAFTSASPGSTAQLAIEGEGEPLGQFREWTAERGALSLAGTKEAVDAVDPEDREAPGHSDGLVSISSASLRDSGVPFATTHLSHFDLARTETAAAIIAAYLEDPRKITSHPGIEAGEALQGGACGPIARAGLQVDARQFSACGQGGVSSIRWIPGTGAATNLSLAGLAHYFWSRTTDSRLAASAAYPGSALVLGPEMTSELEGVIQIACRTPGSSVYERRVRLQPCQTNFFPTTEADTLAVAAPPATWTLSLRKYGPGAITSDVADLACDAACTGVTRQISAANIVLSASPRELFRGWGGACSGSELTCTVALHQDRQVWAYFAPANTISGISLTPNILYPGAASLVTVAISQPAPAGGITIPLTNSSPSSAIIPASIFIPPNQKSASFLATRGTGDAPSVITARYGGAEVKDTLWSTDKTLTPANLRAFSMDFVRIPAEPTMPAFELGKYEVTQAQWQAVMDRNPSEFRGDNLPVEQINWDLIQEFLTRLNTRNDGYRYRLPTDAEWEFSVRAGGGYDITFDAMHAVGWFRPTANNRTQPVGTKRPNAWGLHDMFGNVSEVIADWNGGVMKGSLVGPRYQSVQRGCSFMCQYFDNLYLQTGPHVSSSQFGFRVARDRLPRPVSLAMDEVVFATPAVPSGGIATARVSLNDLAPFPGAVITVERGLGPAATVVANIAVPAGRSGAAFSVPAPAVSTNQPVPYLFRLGASSRTVTLNVTARPAAGSPLPGPFGMTFVPVPAGEYMRGCSEFDWGCVGNEQPAHRVRLTRGFEIGQFEVTNAQWAASGGAVSATADPRHPVTGSWVAATAFANRLTSRNDGYRYRLPTEAEWEWAARAATADRETGIPADDLAWHQGNNSGQLQPVGLKSPNYWGIHDMIGNAWEWTQDLYEQPYPTAPQVDPLGVISRGDPLRAIRGLAGIPSTSLYSNDPLYPALAAGPSRRTSESPFNFGRLQGFRLIRERIDGGLAPALAGVNAHSRTEVMTGQSIVVTLSVSNWAPPAGFPVTVRVSEPGALIVPETITMPAGFSEVEFLITGGPVDSRRTVTITYQAGPVTRTQTLTAVPLPAASEPVEGPSGIRFVAIQPGEYSRGCSPLDNDCSPVENPRHTVRITKLFELSQYEVTQKQWQEVTDWNPSEFQDPQHPVEKVGYDDIRDFLRRLNLRNDGYEYRLPTEGEWEWAARAGTSDARVGVLDEVAWHAGNSGGRTHPVGEKKPNNWGLHDMIGNVAEFMTEWIWFYPFDPQVDPQGIQGPPPLSGALRLGRGGSWRSSAQNSRVSARANTPPGGGPDVGFRVLRVKK